MVDYLGKAEYLHDKMFGLNKGQIGISANFRNFNVGGYVFTSPAKLYNFSAYIYENANWGKAALEFAARYNFDFINPKYKNTLTSIGLIKEKRFNTYSLSTSILYPLSNIVFIGGNLSKSSRIPSIEELYSRGPHLAAYSYEVGNPDLNDESGFGAELFVYHKFDNLFFNISVFRNYSDYYIIPRNSGKINYATFLPVYESQGIKALFYGYEFTADFAFDENYSLRVSSSYTVGKNLTDNVYLPQIPPLKGSIELKYSINNFAAFLNSEFALKQNKLDYFEIETAGYVIFNIAFQYSFRYLDMMNNLSFNVDNIFNKEYRNHLSRIRSIMPETGRNFRLNYKIFFHL